MDDTSLCYNKNISDGRCSLFLLYIFTRVRFLKKKKEIVDFKWLNFSIQPFI